MSKKVKDQILVESYNQGVYEDMNMHLERREYNRTVARMNENVAGERY
jgi:hypothetical protein